LLAAGFEGVAGALLALAAGNWGRVIGGAPLAGRSAGRDRPAMNSLSLTTSSSDMLASAEPLS